MFYGSFKHTTGSGICVNEAATIMEDDSVKPSMYEDFTEGAMVAVAESEANYTKLMMGIGIAEAVAYSETGEAMVYTEGFVSDVVDKIKAFFKKLWEKIKALFKRFVLMFDQYFKNDKDFLKKYKSRILKSDAKDMTFNGYPFKDAKGLKGYQTNVFTSADALQSEIDTKLGEASKYSANSDNNEKLSELREDIMDEIRGKFCGQSSVSSSDFHDELFEYFHGSTSKESLNDSDINLSDCIVTIEKSKDANKEAQKQLDSVGKYIDKVVKKVEDEMKKSVADNKAGDGTDEAKTTFEANANKTTNTKIALYRDAAGIMTQAYGAYLTALKDMNRQARAICAKAIVKSGKINEESAGSEYFGGGSFLSGVVFK